MAAGYAGRTACLTGGKIASGTAQAGPYGPVAEPLTRCSAVRNASGQQIATVLY
jgi:hypothetical protein